MLVVGTDVGSLKNYQPTQRKIPKSQDLVNTQRKKPEMSRIFGLRGRVYNRWQPVYK